MTQQRELDALAQEIISSGVCSSLANQATQLVMGEGNPNADIMLIGEAPGKREDESGRPFVGAAGKFLDEMLKSAGLMRDDVYITNIVKYRPPNNRDPLADEKAAFLPYLLRQIDIINPKVIMTLGRHSMEYFLPNVLISEVHGSAIGTYALRGEDDRRKVMIVPLYHPAAALYNGGMRQTLIDDFMHTAQLVKLMP